MNPHDANIFAIRLRIARKARKISQERLGILAGMDESSASARMNQYERGKHVPDFLTVAKIAESLGLPTAYFYTDDDLLAEIIKQYSNLTENQKQQLLEFIQNLITMEIEIPIEKL